MKIIIRVFLIALLVIGVPAMAQEDQEVLGPETLPTTVEATVDDIISALSEKNKETVRTTKREDLIKFRHGWGTGIRNHYGLWHGNETLLESACGRACHPDDASMIIIEAVWNKLQKEPT